MSGIEFDNNAFEHELPGDSAMFPGLIIEEDGKAVVKGGMHTFSPEEIVDKGRVIDMKTGAVIDEWTKSPEEDIRFRISDIEDHQRSNN
jgi:hypothetical protein